MITASHNPKEYNGYKVYGEDGAQMSPEDTAKVVGYIQKIEDYLSVSGDKKSDLIVLFYLFLLKTAFTVCLSLIK
jgi:phosphoglucomutase